MRLRTIVPALPEALLEALEDCGLRTHTDLLFSGTALQIYGKLPQGIVTLAELEVHIRNVTSHIAAPGIRADELLVQDRAKHDANGFGRISCGVPELDKLTDGFSGPRVLEISGDHRSGKTLIALQIIMQQLSKEARHTALWMDTAGDFSVDRIPPILSSCSDLPAANTASERLQVALAFDVSTAQEVLETLYHDSNIPEQPARVHYLVIDSITTLFRPLLSVVSSQGHATMATFMQQLRSLADTCSLSVLVINATSSAVPTYLNSAFAATQRKPGLGPSFAYMTDGTLWLAKFHPPAFGEDLPQHQDTDGAVSVHIAEVLRSKFTPSRSWCSFKVHNGVICHK